MAQHRGYTRRTLIEGLGLTGAAYFLPELRSPKVGAATPGAKRKRFIVWWNGSGTLKQMWAPKPPVGGGPVTEANWSLGPLHEPLAAHRDDMIFLEGLGFKSRDLDRTNYRDGHTPGNVHSLTGASESTPGQISVDQFIARAINKPAPQTLLPSLEICIAASDGAPGNKFCYSGPGQPMSMMNDPRTIYKRLFSGALPQPMQPDVAAMERAKRAAQEKSVLDAVVADFEKAARRLGAHDRVRLEANAQAVRDMEKRLGALTGDGSVGMPVACSGPPDPAFLDTLGAGGKTLFEIYWQKPPNVGMFRKHVDAHIRLIQAAFACDLTRVISINVEEIADSEWGFRNGDFGASDAHDLVHKTSPRYGSGGLWGNQAAVDRMAAMHKVEATYIAKLVAALKEVKEADGTTAFDNTTLLWCGQIAEGWHSMNELPWILIGGAGGAMKTGRYLKYPGKPHNDLLVSLANAMGAPTTTFGLREACTGPLPGLVNA